MSENTPPPEPAGDPGPDESVAAPASASHPAPGPAPAPYGAPPYGAPPYGVPYGPPPFAPVVRQPWINPAKRNPFLIVSIATLLVVAAAAFVIGLAVGDTGGHGDHRRFGPGPEFGYGCLSRPEMPANGKCMIVGPGFDRHHRRGPLTNQPASPLPSTPSSVSSSPSK